MRNDSWNLGNENLDNDLLNLRNDPYNFENFPKTSQKMINNFENYP